MVKSIAGHFGEKTDGCVDFLIGGERIPNVKAFIHLGLPIGNVKDFFNFFDDKIKKDKIFLIIFQERSYKDKLQRFCHYK